MTISELQILFDINKGNECALLKEHACFTKHGYFFINSEDGQCYLFDIFNKNVKIDDIKKIDAIYESYVKIDIKKIVIPKGVKKIGNDAFAYCTSLTSVEIPESVESIDNDAFFDCASLTSIEIPKCVKHIGDYAFSYCSSLTSIIFKGKAIDQVKAMDRYPWGIKDEAIIKCS